MKRNLSLIAGAVALTVLGAFAGRLPNRYAVTKLYGKNWSKTVIPIASTAISGNFTTINSGSLHQAVIYTSGPLMTPFRLYSTFGCTIPVYFQ